MKRIQKLLVKNKTVLLLILLLFLMVIFRSIQQNKLFSFMTRADDDVVIVEGKCDSSMCTGRKTSDGKQVCVKVGFISPLNDKCYECFGSNQGKRSDLSVAHWEETDMGKCLDISAPPSTPSSCPVCPTCSQQSTTPTPPPSEDTPSPSPTGQQQINAVPVNLNLINKCSYNLYLWDVSISYDDENEASGRTLEKIDINQNLGSGGSYKIKHSIGCNPSILVPADCCSKNNKINITKSCNDLIQLEGCLEENQEIIFELDHCGAAPSDCNSSSTPTNPPNATNTPVPTSTLTPTPPITKRTPTPTRTPTATPVPTSTPSPTPPPQNGNKIINLIYNQAIKWYNIELKKVKIYKFTVDNKSVNLPSDTIKLSTKMSVNVKDYLENCSTFAPVIVEYRPCDIFNICITYPLHSKNVGISCTSSSEVDINLD